jgi:hypothetical protein
MEERQGRMIKASMNLQELRRKIYSKAKTEKDWKFWERTEGLRLEAVE